ncbi:MAG: hypothetical protein Q9225_000210 [Loekoesia sp. 1 TL-2023]
MHKIGSSASARQQAWYASGGSHVEHNYNLNPFARVRKTSVYAEPDHDEGPKPLDSDNFVAELVRRGTRKLSFVKSEDIDIKKRRPTEPKITQSFAPADEEKPASLHEEQPSLVEESRSITWKQRAFLHWRRWRSQLTRFGLGSQWEVKPAIADIATSTIASAPLSATGQYLLPATPRPQQTFIVEYQNNQSGAAGYPPL